MRGSQHFHSHHRPCCSLHWAKAASCCKFATHISWHMQHLVWVVDASLLFYLLHIMVYHWAGQSGVCMVLCVLCILCVVESVGMMCATIFWVCGWGDVGTVFVESSYSKGHLTGANGGWLLAGPWRCRKGSVHLDRRSPGLCSLCSLCRRRAFYIAAVPNWCLGQWNSSRDAWAVTVW